MGQPAGQLADQLHLLRLVELFLGFLAISDIGLDDDPVHDLAAVIADGAGIDFCPERATVPGVKP